MNDADHENLLKATEARALEARGGEFRAAGGDIPLPGNLIIWDDVSDREQDLLDRFAAAIASGLLAFSGSNTPVDELARTSYSIAEALLAERRRRIGDL